MITENKINDIIDYKIRVNKIFVPRSANKSLPPFFYSALFIGATGTGKTFKLVELLKLYEKYDILDSKGNKLDMRVVLFCTTANSKANAVYNDSSLPAGSGAGGDLRADRASAQPSTTRGRPRELNPRRTAAPRGCGRAPPAPAPPPAPSDGSVASDPLEVVGRRPVAIMAGTYGRMGRPTTGPGMDTDVSVQARIAPDDSDQAG